MTESDADIIKTPSLLERESRGGEIAQRGFAFQAGVALSLLPRWLAADGFSALAQEAIGDIEAKFYVPGRGFVIELVEVKDHRVTPSEFWKEIARFKEIDHGSSGTYPWFTLVCTDLSQEVKSLASTLRRVRGYHAFYDDSHVIKGNSFRDYVAEVNKHGRTEADATFLFRKVLIETDIIRDSSQCEALFKQALAGYFPEYQELPARSLTSMYTSLAELLRSRKTGTASRLEVEAALHSSLDPANMPQLRPVMIHTGVNAERVDAGGALTFEWSEFWGGEERQFPDSQHWNVRLLGELTTTRDWIAQHRGMRQIRLTGNRRLSVSFAIGAIYSAVAGFSLAMDYRGESWSTNAHPTAETPDYSLNISTSVGQRQELVISVGILHDISEEVNTTLGDLGLTDVPLLSLTGSEAIVSPQQANLAVRKIKSAVMDELDRIHATQIHLFFAGPAFLALFLAHRLNATAPVQCYERTSPGKYVPTCLLFSPNG